MKSVLISIQPKWCELIASGKKTVEVRKTRPKLETPFKVYIYCTMGGLPKHIYNENLEKESIYANHPDIINGKVICEFVCDKVVEFENSMYEPEFDETSYLSCVGYDELALYLGKNDVGYGWHISDLVIYDKPKELGEFYKYTEYDNSNNDFRPCRWCEHNKFDWSENCEYCDIDFDGEHCIHLQMKRPPQSWCYVESVGDDNA